MPESNKSLGAQVQGEGFGSDGNESDSSGEQSNRLLGSLLEPNPTPYISFGEGADATYRRAISNFSKHTRTIQAFDLIYRLADLPAENEYVLRKVRDPTPTCSIDGDMPSGNTTASYCTSSPSEEVKLEREKTLARLRAFREAYRKSQRSPTPTNEATETLPRSRPVPSENTPAQLPARRTSQRVSFVSPPSLTKGGLGKTRGGKVEKNFRPSRTINTDGDLSQQAVAIEGSSPDRAPKRSRWGLNTAEGSGKLASQAPLKLDKTVQAQRPAKFCQRPLRMSRRLAGKQPEFDMLPYEGTPLQKREASEKKY